MKVSRRGQNEGTAASPVTDHREGKDRLGGAAMQRRGTTASSREDNRVGGGEAGRQERGVQGGGRKAAGTGTVNQMRER